jgi:hypothetical protein
MVRIAQVGYGVAELSCGHTIWQIKPHVTMSVPIAQSTAITLILV